MTNGPTRALEAREAALGLSWLCAGGIHSLLRLLARWGPVAIWRAPRRRLLEWGIDPSTAARFETRRREFALDEAEAMLLRGGIAFLPYGSAGYPRELMQLELPPAGLFARGSDSALSRLLSVSRITIVGTRKATTYGLRAAEMFATAFVGKGVAVVSGMASGIDGRAHEATLDAGGLTVGILGCGVDVAYPSRHRGLYEKIRQSGVILSELPPGTPPARWTFPRRNRLLAALGDALLVVEGSPTSGALQTAGWSLDLGRPVFAVPGPISIESHRGCNQLLYEGAGPAVDPCVTVEDFFLQTRINTCEYGRAGGGEDATPIVVGQMGLFDRSAPKQPRLDSILTALGDGPCSVDRLIDSTGLSARQLNVALGELEIAGLVARAGPGQFIRAP